MITYDKCNICTNEWESTGKHSPSRCPYCGSEDIDDASVNIYDEED